MRSPLTCGSGRYRPRMVKVSRVSSFELKVRDQGIRGGGCGHRIPALVRIVGSRHLVALDQQSAQLAILSGAEALLLAMPRGRGVTDVPAWWVGPRRTPQDSSCGYRYQARRVPSGCRARDRGSLLQRASCCQLRASARRRAGPPAERSVAPIGNLAGNGHK